MLSTLELRECARGAFRKYQLFQPQLNRAIADKWPPMANINAMEYAGHGLVRNKFFVIAMGQNCEVFDNDFKTFYFAQLQNSITFLFLWLS